MNTPDPCGSCGFCYADCMQEENSADMAECLKGLAMGNDNCAGYKHFSKVSMAEKWGK